MSDLVEAALGVSSRDELAEYLANMVADIQTGRIAVENDTTARFVEAAAAWVGDMAGFLQNIGDELPSKPSSSLIAMIFSAGLIYE